MLSPHEIREICQAGKDRDPGWYRIHRRISIHITARIVQTRVTLNHISALMLSLGALGAGLNASSNLLVNALGWACLYGAFLLDKVDGEVARFRRQESVMGILLDRFHHRLVEPLLFLAVGWRAFSATGTPAPLFAALATMLAANVVEETQHLHAYIAVKHARETHAWPVQRRAPSARWRRAAAWMRPLKTFRMFITVLPLVAGAELLEALTRWPVTTWLLVTSAVALWVYAVFQACYYASGRLEADIEALTRTLPPLPERGPAAADVPTDAGTPSANGEPGPDVRAGAPPETDVRSDDPRLEPAAPEAPIAWPLPRRARRSVTLAVEQADAERARGRHPGAGPLAVLLLLGLLAGTASAGTYYVDATSPQCSPAGPGTLGQPYCTITDAIAARGTAGNTILVQPGTYRETITFPASGTSLAPIVLRANGPGVVIDGADDFGTTGAWVQFSGAVWLAAGVNGSPAQVFADGSRLTASSSSPSALQSGTYRYVSGQGLYVNAGGGNPGTHGVLVGRRANALVLSGKSWITIDGFKMTRTEERSIRLTGGAADVAILNCTVTFSNKYGIYLNNCARVRIAGNVVTDHNSHGIVLTAGTSGCLVENNESARNAVPGARSANGLYLYGSTGNTVRRNRWHDNQDTGQHMQSGSNDNLSYENVSWNNGDHGYDHVGTSGTRHFNDVAYGNFKDGFSIEGSSPNTQLTNCIAVNNGLTTGEYDLWVDNASSAGFVSNDNIFWNSTSQPPFKYLSTVYATLAGYQAASGQDSRTRQADPQFLNPSAGNFNLVAGSPAIDNGNSSSPDWPAADAGGYARVDDPSTPNTGQGPIAYSDRGAWEFQPAGLPPVAALVATPAVATAPAIVTLDASGSSDPEGTLLSYSFDFGDGASAGPQASPIAVHTYAAGTYTATVTVVDSAGLGDSASVTVIANQRPVASIAGAPLSGRSPLAVSFNASGSSDADGTVVLYTFDFGDGTIVGPQAAATTTHTYATGNWQASATVTDDRGAVSLPSAPLAVSVAPPNQPPSAALALSPLGGRAPLAVTADASASSDADGSLASYRFDFGDGTVVGPQPGATAAHTFAAGPHTVTLRVTDNDGDTASVSKSLTVSPPDQPPVVAAPATVTASEGGTVTVNVTATDPDGDAILDLSAVLSQLPAGNDAAFTPAPDLSGGQLVWHPTYADSGSYLVTFVAGNALSDSASTQLRIENADRAPVVTAPGSSSTRADGTPFSLSVTAGDPDGDPIDSLVANLANLPAGNGAMFTPAADGLSGSFTWTPAPGDTGSYALGFTAANVLSGSATTVLTVRPPNLPPTAVLTATPRTGNAPLAVSASAAGSSDPEGGPLTYRFEFGDGVVVGPQPSATTTHHYAAGTWTLLVAVTDAAGTVSTATTSLTVAASGQGLNLVANPSFEWNTSGWSAFSGSSFGRITGGFDGGRCLRIVGPANLSGFGIDDSTNWVAATSGTGAHYRFAAWVRSGGSRGSARLRIREFVGSTQVGSTVTSVAVALTPEWQLVLADFVARAAGSTLDFQIYDQPLVQREVFEVDNVSIERVPEPATRSPVTTSAGPVEPLDPRGPGGAAPIDPPPSGSNSGDTTAVARSGRAPVSAEMQAASPNGLPVRFAVSIAPSLAAPEATLTFSTTRPSPVRIELYDLEGRRVRRVLDTPFMAPGLHHVTLDGRSDQGDRLGSGVYFYRVQAAERSVTGRFAIVR